jgi:hypothetical protein
MNDDAVIRRFRGRLRKIIADLGELIADAEGAMEVRPNLPRIDLETAYLQRDGARKALAALDSGEPIDPAWLRHLDG